MRGIAVAGDGIDVDPQRRVPVGRVPRREELRGRDEQQNVEQHCDAETFEHDARVSGDGAASEARARDARSVGAHHGMRRFLRGPEKKNPAVGTPGQIFLLSEFTVSSMRPGCCSLRPKARSGLLLLSSQLSFLVLLLSCSSLTFSNLTEPFAISHRFLSVCALTRPWVGTTCIKQDTCHGVKIL